MQTLKPWKGGQRSAQSRQHPYEREFIGVLEHICVFIDVRTRSPPMHTRGVGLITYTNGLYGYAKARATSVIDAKNSSDCDCMWKSTFSCSTPRYS